MAGDEVRHRLDARVEDRGGRYLNVIRAAARVLALIFPRHVREATPTLVDVAEHRWNREVARTRGAGARTLRTLVFVAADALRTAPGLWMSSLMPARSRGGKQIFPPLHRLFAGLPSDLRLAGRALRARPGFSLLVIATLGLGIGASTAAFDALDRAILRPLPFPAADRVVLISLRDPDTGYVTAPAPGAAPRWRSLTRTLESLEVADRRPVDLIASGRTERSQLLSVSAGIPRLLQVKPVIGRLVGPGDSETAVMLSEQTWRHEMGSDPDVLGRTVTLDGIARTIGGVWPAAARLEIRSDSQPPYVRVMPEREVESGQFRLIFGVMRPGVSPADVERELASIVRNGESPDGWRPVARRPYETMGRGWTTAIWLTFGAAIVLLAVSVLNAGHLIAVRAAARQPEVAVRLAIGGSHLRVVRLLVVEGLVYGLGGVAVGAGCAWAFERLIAAEQPWMFAEVVGAGLAGRALAFSGMATLAATVACALEPVIVARSCRASHVIDGRRGDRVTNRASRGRIVVSAAQAALAVALVSGAALMGRSFGELITTDTGIEIERLAMLSVRPPSQADAEATQDYLRRLRDSIAATPGVAHVTSSGTTSLLSSSGALSTAYLEGEPEPDRSGGFTATVSGPIGYLETVGARLVEGRFLTAEDPLDTVVVSESFARRRAESVVGRRLVVPWASGSPAEQTRWIVGVVADARMSGLTRDAVDTIYSRSGQLHPRFIIRTSQEPSSVLSAVRARAAAVDPSVPIGPLETGMDVVHRQTAQHRLLALLLGVLGALGLALAMAGLYGIVSLEVARRTREMGVRIALGATAARLSAHVLRYGLVPVLIGATAGAAVTMALAPRVQSLLFEVPARDPWSAAAGILIVTLAAALATLVPARRASRIDPAQTLRA